MQSKPIESAGPREQTQISGQIQRLKEAIALVEELRQKLEERFGAVLRPNVPSTVGGEKIKDCQQMVPLAEELATLIARLEAQSRGMDDMLQRVEL